MNLRIYLIGLCTAFAGTAVLSGCGDEGTIGSSLLEDEVQIVVDSAFTLSGSSVRLENVQPRTLTQLLGNVNIPGYGRISSSVVAQFMPVVALDTAEYGVANIDSAFMNFVYYPGNFIGDSIVPMGVAVYPLTQQLPAEINTNFSPEGYFDSNNKLASRVYAPSTLDKSLTDGSIRTMALKLPHQFAVSLFDAFLANPDNYASGQLFTKNVFPGIFMDNDFGTGRLMRFERTSITFNMHKYTWNEDKKKNDTVYTVQEYYAVSPEVISNNNLSVELEESLRQRIESGAAAMVAPAGYGARLRFPAPEIMAAYRAHGGLLAVLNTVSMEIPADTLDADGVSAPPYALLVREKDLEEFFAENKLPDNRTSFYAEFNKTSGSYTFGALAPYVLELLEKDASDISEEDYTFMMVPVQVNFEQDMTSYYNKYVVSEVLPYIQSPAVAIMSLDKAKIKLTYSRQVEM